MLNLTFKQGYASVITSPYVQVKNRTCIAKSTPFLLFFLQTTWEDDRYRKYREIQFHSLSRK